VVHIEGVGRRIVQDRLAPERDNSFDVFMPRHADAKKFGKRKLKVRIIQTDTKKTK
jgi:3D (Asp-Asp-Asp) domain-containing protein